MKRMTNYWKKVPLYYKVVHFQLAEMKRIRLLPPIVEWVKKKLFTDLNRLAKEDVFYLDVMGEKLAYKVVEKTVVLPTNVEKLSIKKNQDLVTLVTCTPYAVNTHRLLVTAKRTQMDGSANERIKRTKNYQFWLAVLLSAG